MTRIIEPGPPCLFTYQRNRWHKACIRAAVRFLSAKNVPHETRVKLMMRALELA